MTFLASRDVIEDGDTVIVYLDHQSSVVVKVKRGVTLHMKYGALRHEFLIGKRYGTQISATAGYIYALRPSPHLWTRTMSRSTQILYTPDIASILMLLDVKPGAVICESGTGSGSLSHAIATAIAPNGHLYTHDIDESRVRKVESDLKEHGLAGCTTAILQDACEDGFFVENACDGVFLDLPAPWAAISHAKRAISRSRGGRLVGFSPCIEQVQKMCAELERQGFVQLQTMELMPRNLKAIEVVSRTLKDFDTPTSLLQQTTNGEQGSLRGRKRKSAANKNPTHNEPMPEGEEKWEQSTRVKHLEAIAFPSNQPTHTGYLTSATLLPSSIA